MNRYIPLILTGVLLNAFAQITLKHGMKIIGEFSFTLGNFIPIAIKAALNPFIALGIAFYVISVGVWLMVLSRVDVTYAYPLLSVGYIVTAVAGQLFLNEPMSAIRWGGVVVICIGVFLITRTV
ncbi:MAG: EamA family transporter [Pseudomonadota bacterium]